MFFSKFGMARIASQRFVHETLHFCVWLTRYCTFFCIFSNKKTRIEMLRTSVQFSAREIRSDTFRAFWDDVRTKTTPA